jgi:hypothetical protein
MIAAIHARWTAWLLCALTLTGCASDRIPVAPAAGQTSAKLQADAEECRTKGAQTPQYRTGYFMACMVYLNYRTYVAIPSPWRGQGPSTSPRHGATCSTRSSPT